MEKELADLSLGKEKEEGVQFDLEGQPQTSMYDLGLVGCCLIASMLNFSALKTQWKIYCIHWGEYRSLT